MYLVYRLRLMRRQDYEMSKSSKTYLMEHLFRIWVGVEEFTDTKGMHRQLFGDRVDAVVTAYPEEYPQLEDLGMLHYASEYFDQALQLIRAHDELAAPGIIEDAEEARQAYYLGFLERMAIDPEDDHPFKFVRDLPLERFSPEAQIESLERGFQDLFPVTAGHPLSGPVDFELLFLYEALSRLDLMISRAQKDLAKRHLLWNLPKKVNDYVGEAARVFRHGFDKACIAMCRSALEEALRDRIQKDYGPDFLRRFKIAQLPNTEPDLKSMIFFAFRVKKFLPYRLFEPAEQIRELGNKVLHGNYDQNELEDMARNSLFYTRLILAFLYK